MKGLKKVLSLILVTVMAFGMMSFPSFADEEPSGVNLKVTASTEEKLKAGDELTAVVTVPAPAEEFASCSVRMDFNKDILEATDVKVEGMSSPTVSSAESANNNGFATAMMYGSENIKQTEDIVLTAVFKIKEGVYEDDYKDLITVNQEETLFTNIDDEDLTIAFDESALSYDASIDGLYKVKIPEGAAFTEVTTDSENGRVNITSLGTATAVIWGSEKTVDPLYMFEVTPDVNTLYITVPLDKVYFAPGYNDQRLEGWHKSGGTGFNGCTHSEVDGVKYITFPIPVANWKYDDDKYCGPYDKNMNPLFGITTDIHCDHEHVTKTEAVEATCTEAGNIEYWYCEDCERYYSDEELTKRIKNIDSTVIKPLGHTFGEDGLCIRCGLRGDANVKFVGDGVAKVTDQSDDDNKENAGLDYTFKAGNGIVSSVKGYTVSANEIGLRAQMFDQNAVTIVEDGTVEFDGKTIPNYTAYLSGRCFINGNTIDEDDSDRYEWYIQNGVYDANGRQTSITAFNIDNFTQPVQYYVYVDYNEGRNWNAQDEYYEDYERISHDLAFGIKVVKGTAPDPVLTEMEADEDGVYTIPASEMKAGATVVISVEKPAFEKVEAKIDAIGVVTLEKEDAIKDARDAYDALSDEDKELVPLNYPIKLLEAELKLANLKAEKAAADAAAAEQAAKEEAQALQAAKDAAIADINAYADEKAASAEPNTVKVAALEGINAVKDAADQDAIDAAVAAAKADIDALVQAKADADAAAAQAAAEAAAAEQAAKEEAQALQAAKDAAIADINAYAEEKAASAEPNTVKVAALEGINAVKNAADQDAIDAAVAAAKADIDALVQAKADADTAAAQAAEQAAQEAAQKEFEDAVDAANHAVDAVKASDYAEADQDKVEAAVAAAKEAIAAAKTPEEAAQAIAALNEKLAECKTAEAEAKEESDAFADSKTKAINDINKYMEDNLQNMLEDDQVTAEIAALQNIIKIQNAADKDAVDKAVAAAKAVVDEKVQIKADTDAAKALKVEGLKAKSKKQKFTVSWKQNADAEGYDVQYKLKSAKKFSSLKKNVTKVKVTSKKLKKGKKYVFQVRTYKTVNGAKVYGEWVKTKAVKCK